MISLREAKYCNLKSVLIYLVVLGHMIEPRIGTSRILETVYRLIYTFHMPMFAFLTGLFVKSAENCKKQGIRLLKLYCVVQILIVAVSLGEQSFVTPWWHLWYLLSGVWWMCLGRIWFRYGKAEWKLPFLICAVILGCAVGYIPWINRGLSLSRTIVFFPFYFAGLLCQPVPIGGKYRWIAILSVTLGIALFIMILGNVSVSFLYQAESYDDLPNGWIYRVASYGAGAGISLFLMVFISKKKRWYTKFGSDTLIPYLLHGPLVLLLRKLPIPVFLLPVVTLFLLWVLYRASSLLYKVYGIQETIS